MAMRSYGVETNGMVLTLDDFQDLLNKNVKGIVKSGNLELLGIEEEDLDESGDLSLVDLIDYTDIVDFIYEIDNATFFGEIEGYIENDKTQERTYFNGDDIVLFDLSKNTLYDKYENRDEIIKELKDDLASVGIKVDNKYIEEHFGYISASYIA